MEDKLIVSIEHYGTKYTTETTAQTDYLEFVEIVFNLMCSTSHHRDDIIEGFKNVIEQQEI